MIQVWRILGNDMPPRHADNQTVTNLRFMLEHEPKHEEVERCWLLNRIADSEKVAACRDLLRNEKWWEMPFDPVAYRELDGPDAQFRYATNLNTARNFCISQGFEQGADAVLPLDGGCAFREDGLGALVDYILLARASSIEVGYVAIPMWRTLDYMAYLDMDVPPQLREEYKVGPDGTYRVIGIREPQLAFLPEHDLRFNEAIPYGRCPKVELLWRIGVPGVWDKWWEMSMRKVAMQAGLSKFYGQIDMIGYVCRLPSGNAKAEEDNLLRGTARGYGVQRFLQSSSCS